MEKTIKASCSCGATLEVSGSSISCGIEYERFLKAHSGCEKIYSAGFEPGVSEPLNDADPGSEASEKGHEMPRCAGYGRSCSNMEKWISI